MVEPGFKHRLFDSRDPTLDFSTLILVPSEFGSCPTNNDRELMEHSSSKGHIQVLWECPDHIDWFRWDSGRHYFRKHIGMHWYFHPMLWWKAQQLTGQAPTSTKLMHPATMLGWQRISDHWDLLMALRSILERQHGTEEDARQYEKWKVQRLWTYNWVQLLLYCQGTWANLCPLGLSSVK